MIYKHAPEVPLADNITFIVTDDCNLRCRYCYEKDKKPHDMSIETAKEATDFFIDTWENRYDEVIIDFIGGEPFVRIDLIEEIVPYLIKKLNRSQKWKKFTFSFSTNGTCFSDTRVRDFIEKYHDYLSVGLSLDGCKEIHDYNRNDSFDEVMKWFPYWRRQFPECTTKSTLNHEAIPYVFESIKFLTSTCLSYVFMNTVYEDVWMPGDDNIFYAQLCKCADYIIENDIYKDK